MLKSVKRKTIYMKYIILYGHIFLHTYRRTMLK